VPKTYLHVAILSETHRRHDALPGNFRHSVNERIPPFRYKKTPLEINQEAIGRGTTLIHPMLKKAGTSFPLLTVVGVTGLPYFGV